MKHVYVSWWCNVQWNNVDTHAHAHAQLAISKYFPCANSRPMVKYMVVSELWKRFSTRDLKKYVYGKEKRHIRPQLLLMVWFFTGTWIALKSYHHRKPNAIRILWFAKTRLVKDFWSNTHHALTTFMNPIVSSEWQEQWKALPLPQAEPLYSFDNALYSCSWFRLLPSFFFFFFFLLTIRADRYLCKILMDRQSHIVGKEERQDYIIC